MYLGLKYCGGCSPDYDRGEQVRYLTQELGDLVKLTSPEDLRAEHVLVVMGCKNACADLSSFDDKEITLILGEADFDEVIKKLFVIAKGAV